MMKKCTFILVGLVLLTSALVGSEDRNKIASSDTLETHLKLSHPMPKAQRKKKTSPSEEWFTFDDLVDFKYWDDGSSLYLKFYGRYGGYGNKGGKAWDDLDRVFQKHDYRYGEHGFLDAKSDARLLQEIPFVLFHKNIHKEGYILGPAAFLFFATSLPSIYRLKINDGKITLPLIMPNASCALCAYRMEETIKFIPHYHQIEDELKRVEKKTKAFNKDSEKWLKEQGEDAEDFLKKAF